VQTSTIAPRLTRIAGLRPSSRGTDRVAEAGGELLVNGGCVHEPAPAVDRRPHRKILGRTDDI